MIVEKKIVFYEKEIIVSLIGGIEIEVIIK